MNHFKLQCEDINFSFLKTNIMAPIVHSPQLLTILGTAFDLWWIGDMAQGTSISNVSIYTWFRVLTIYRAALKAYWKQKTGGGNGSPEAQLSPRKSFYLSSSPLICKITKAHGYCEHKVKEGSASSAP